MTRTPRLAFWRALELQSILDRNYSRRVWEARRDMVQRVMANCARMNAAGYLQPGRLPE